MLIQTQDELPPLSPFNPYASNVGYQAEEISISSLSSWIRCSPAASETFLTISQEFILLCGLVQKKEKVFSHQEKKTIGMGTMY